MSTVTSLFCDTEAAMALFVASVYLAVNVVVSVALTRSALALSFADTFTSSTLRFVKLPSYPPVPI